MTEQKTDGQLNPSEPNDEGKKPVTFTPEQQEILNREIAEVKRKEREKMLAEIDAEKLRLTRESRERELLDKENFKQLAEDRERELTALRVELESKALNEKTGTLLDNAGITSPKLRKMAMALPPDLEQRAAYIADLQAEITGETNAQVSERLKIAAPERGGTVPAVKRIADMTPEEKVAFRKEKGDQAFVEAVRKEKTVPK